MNPYRVENAILMEKSIRQSTRNDVLAVVKSIVVVVPLAHIKH
jgi:hypothetical protein